MRRGAWWMVAGLVAMAGVMAGAQEKEAALRSRLYVYDLRTGASTLVYQAEGIWEAPNWSPEGNYLIANSGGAIYKLPVPAAGAMAVPEKLAVPAELECNNDKAISPDGRRLAFSATAKGGPGSQVFLAGVDGSEPALMTKETPSYFHGWSPDGKTLAFVAQRGGDGQYDIYSVQANAAAEGPEVRLTSDPHQDDGPDYSPDGKWIYINSNRTGKQAIWRFPASGAGPGDARAEMVVNDERQDWFPHPAPDGKKLVYIGYPAGVATHDPRTVAIELKLVGIDKDRVAKAGRVLVRATGGQGTMNVNSWAPDAERFAYVTYERVK